MSDPIFEVAPYLREVDNKPFFPKKAAKIPRRQVIKGVRNWQNWLYDVVSTADQKGQGTIKVYRWGHHIGSAQVSDHAEASRVFQDLIESAKEATMKYEEELTK